MPAFIEEDDLCRNAPCPLVRRLRVHDLVLLAGDDEDRGFYDTCLPDEPPPSDLASHHAEGLGDGCRDGLACVVHDFLGEVISIEDERAHPEPAQGLQKTPQRVEDRT